MSSKISSRKLWAFLIWSILVFGGVIYTKSFDPTVLSWYGAVTMLYLGSNVATKYLFRDKEK